MAAVRHLGFVMCMFGPPTKIGYHGNVPWAIAKRIPDWTSTAICPPTWKCGELRSGMLWDLFAPIKKDERKRKKVTVAEHKPCRPSAWRANDQTPLQHVEYTDHCIYLFTVFHTQSFSHFQRHRDNISNDTNRVVRTVKKHPQEITQYVTCWTALISVTLSDLEGDCLHALWISYTWENMAHINFCKIHLSDLDPLLVHDSLCPSEPKTQTVSWSVQPFLQGSLVWQTDRPRY